MLAIILIRLVDFLPRPIALVYSNPKMKRTIQNLSHKRSRQMLSPA